MGSVEVAELLSHHKSWVCRRLALLERLCPAARDDLSLGLLSPTQARQLVRLSQVLELLEFHPTRRRGSNLRGRCVLCSRAQPERRTSQTQTCFAADLSRDIWHCFGCRQGGDQLTLWSLANRKPLYAATKLLCQSTGLPIPWLT